MKFKVPFQFGDKVRIKASLYKTSRQENGKTFRFWVVSPLPNPTIGIYLGYRNLYDGTIETGDSYKYMEEPEYYSYLKPTKIHRGALICIKNHKPQYVFLEDIERISETPYSKIHTATLDLLAIIHRDGGQHTELVGIEQSVNDAHKVWANLMSNLNE